MTCAYVSAVGALCAWVAESEKCPSCRRARAVMAVGSAATGQPPEQLCVVARLFVSGGPGSGALLTLRLPRGTQPILDIAAHLGNALRLYERAGWMCAWQVTVDFHNETPLDELVYIGPDPARVGHVAGGRGDGRHHRWLSIWDPASQVPSAFIPDQTR